MMLFLVIVQTLQTLKYTWIRKITSLKYNILQLLPCLAQHPSAFASRCPTDREGQGALGPPPQDFYALEPPPEDFDMFHSFKPCRRQSKETLEICHRKIQNIIIATNYRLEMMLIF